MEIKVDYRLWRTLRFLAVIAVLTAIFSIGLLALNFLDVKTGYYPRIALFALLVTLGFFLEGGGDDDVVEWHKEQLLSSRELYSSLYSQSPVPYLTLDMRGYITTCNQAAARLLGIKIVELIGKTIQDRLFDDENEISLAVMFGKISNGTPIVDKELGLSTFNGETRFVSVSIFANDTFGQRLVTMVDITQHRIVDKAKSEFVALATHQLRTPIAAIRWNVELLERSLRGATTDKQTAYLAKVGRNVTRMLALITDFLSVSKLETGTFATTPEPLELAAYLPTITEEFEGQIKEKQINLVETYNPTPLTFTTDSRLFHIITSNLLSNAVKYVRPQDTIYFGYTVEGSELVFTVADTGIGVPSEQIPRLFTKFFRASNAMDMRTEGTGLGLYIVKESVEQLGGTISVSSIINEGTSFVIRLPLA